MNYGYLVQRACKKCPQFSCILHSKRENNVMAINELPTIFPQILVNCKFYLPMASNF